MRVFIESSYPVFPLEKDITLNDSNIMKMFTDEVIEFMRSESSSNSISCSNKGYGWEIVVKFREFLGCIISLNASY